MAKKMQRRTPRVGDIVYYVSYGTPNAEYVSCDRAAIITQIVSLGGVDDLTPMRVGLAVLNPSGMFFHDNLPYDPAGHPGTWHFKE